MQNSTQLIVSFEFGLFVNRAFRKQCMLEGFKYIGCTMQNSQTVKWCLDDLGIGNSTNNRHIIWDVKDIGLQIENSQQLNASVDMWLILSKAIETYLVILWDVTDNG